MIKRIKTNKKKGFILIELIVVMAVLAVLVLLAAPKFLGHTKEATFTKHISNAKVLEDASARYYLDHGKWPRGADEDKYTPEDVSAYAERIYDITGKELTLEEGNYWDIDYDALSAYAKLPDKSEQENYVLRNPVGKVYYLEGLTIRGQERQSYVEVTHPGDMKDEVEEVLSHPGPLELFAGDSAAGYFGLTPSSDLISGFNLASQVGVTEGVSQFSTEGWLKFSYNGKILYVAKKPIRHSISWNHLDSFGAVDGTKQITISENNYKLRLLTNAEWDVLMNRIHTNNKEWPVNFTDTDLRSGHRQGNGSTTLVQDKSSGTYIFVRGSDSYSSKHVTPASSTYSGYGWRPVLELIQ